MNGSTRTDWSKFEEERLFSNLRPEEPKILNVDEFRAHIAYEALAALARFSVEVFILPAQATKNLDFSLFEHLMIQVCEELAGAARKMDIVSKATKVGIFCVVAYISMASKQMFMSDRVRAAFKATGVEPCNSQMLKTYTTLRDSTKRKKKSTYSLTLLVTRMAPAVAQERCSLKSERGTIKTTQAVFMDDENRKSCLG